MFGQVVQKPSIKLNNNYSTFNVITSDRIDKHQARRLLESLDYLGINAAILACSENEDRLSIKINSVDLFTVKRSKKVAEILFSGAAVFIESIGGITYKEYVYKIGA